MEELNTDDILTFDELLEDDYYKSEFERRVKEYTNSHSGVKGGGENIMENTQQSKEGEIENKGTMLAPGETPDAQPKPETEQAENPTAETTDANLAQEGTSEAPTEPFKEMSAAEFELYNETLRRISKTAKNGLEARYNAFEDAEVKAKVREQVMAGEKPDVKSLAADAVARLSPKEEPLPEEEKTKTMDTGEVAALKAELALVKAGIVPERLDAAKKLFLAEGGEPDKAAEFAAQYPEWKAGGNNGVVFTKAAPVGNKTAANPNNPPFLNDFEKRVAAARKKVGLD